MENSAKRPFGWQDALSYAAGDFGCSMSFALKSTLIIFWTQYMGMDSILYAALLLAAQLWDAVNDPLIGAVMDSDRRKYRRGKFLAYISAGSVGLIAGGALCFIPLPGLSLMAKNILFLAGYILWDAFYTVANVPYGSLLSLISADPGDRASLSAWRSVGALAGQMAAMALVPLLIYDKDQNIVGARVFVTALAMGIVGFAALRFMISTTVIRVDVQPHVSETPEKFNFFSAMGRFLRSRPAMGATIAAMGMFLGMHGGTAAVTVLFQSYFHNVRISGLISMFTMLPVIFITPFVRTLVKRFGKKELAAAGAVLSVISCALMLVLPISPDRKGMAVYALCQLFNSIGTGVYSVVSWSLMADAIDYNLWRFGARDEGTVYSLHSFFRKLAQGLGPSLVLVIMVSLGYVESRGGSQGMDVALNMRYLVAWLYFASALMIFAGVGLIYDLDRLSLAAMHREMGIKSETNAQ